MMNGFAPQILRGKFALLFLGLADLLATEPARYSEGIDGRAATRTEALAIEKFFDFFFGHVNGLPLQESLRRAPALRENAAAPQPVLTMTIHY